MAGSYMDAPDDRIAWDRDGSVLVNINNAGTITTRSAGDRQSLNSEDEAVVAFGTTRRVAIIFPIPIDISAVFLALALSTLITVETSRNTTNGQDGTWESQSLANLNASRAVKPNYRILSNLYLMTGGPVSQDVRGVRFSFAADTTNVNVRAFHVYGSPSASATTDRLALWNPTVDAPVTPFYFDWGNTPRSTSADKSFRIKNLSSTLTASDIDVYINALTGGSPSVASMLTLSDNGGSTFLSAINISSIAPATISDVIIVRRVIPSNAQVSVWSARIAADVGSWA